MQMFLHPLGRLDLYCKGLFVRQRSFSVDEAEIIAERSDPLGEFSHDSAIKMQASFAFAARKFGSLEKIVYLCNRKSQY